LVFSLLNYHDDSRPHKHKIHQIIIVCISLFVCIRLSEYIDRQTHCNLNTTFHILRWKQTAHIKFHIRGTFHRNAMLKKSNEMQQYADIYVLLNYCTCFGRQLRPSSGVHKTVVAASGTDHK